MSSKSLITLAVIVGIIVGAAVGGIVGAMGTALVFGVFVGIWTKKRHGTKTTQQDQSYHDSPMSSGTPPVLPIQQDVSSLEQHQNDQEIDCIQPSSSISQQIDEQNRPSPTLDLPKKTLLEGELRWIPAGETVDICGHLISAGLIYICNNSNSIDEASAINISLPVDFPAQGYQAELPYYSRYAGLTPAQRGAYLKWLASDRRDADAIPKDPGYVFLFVYGLERRLLLEGENDQEAIRELVRLLHNYQESRSLRSYVCQLIHFWGWKQGLDYYLQLLEWMKTLPVSLLGQDETAIVLAGLHLSGKPLTSELAYDITLRHPDAQRSVVIQRTENELKNLFIKRYSEKFSEGMCLQATKRLTRLFYHPASPTLLRISNSRPDLFELKIPNVLGLSSQFEPLLKIWESCIEDLGSYSRIKAKEGSASSLKVYLALPVELRSQTPHPLSDFWDAIIKEALQEGDCFLIPAAKAATMIEIQQRNKLMLTQSRDIVETIESLGYGVEPDPRRSGVGFFWDQPLGVFRPANQPPTSPTPNCCAAQILLELCVFIAAADGQVSSEELTITRDLIQHQTSLTEDEKQRLSALEKVLIHDPRIANSSFERIARQTPAKDREKIGHLLISIAAADKVITKDELRALERAFDALDIHSDKLNEWLEILSTEFAEVTVQKPAERVPGEIIPPPSKISINMARVAAISKETVEVIGILTAVMAEPVISEAQEPLPNSISTGITAKSAIQNASPAAEIKSGWMEGLDSKYQPLLVKLMEKNSWTRQEFDALSQSFHLMPLDSYGAINDWADDHLGDFLLDGDNPVQINKNLITKGESTHA